MKCGLLGRKLSHSYSPFIHKLLGDYPYELFECEPENLENFLFKTDFSGINVTIPYKKEVMKYCTGISEKAVEIGCVNTLIKQNGKLYGYNTDYDGFYYMVCSTGVDIFGKKAIVLGSGGASLTVCSVLNDLGIGEIRIISRTGPNNYNNLYKHFDAQIIVNATPVGMYPNCPDSLIDLEKFTKCELVLDLIYNPSKTSLLLNAERLGIPCKNGISMLVAQAKRASELFQNTRLTDRDTEQISSFLTKQMKNIILIGMPGCGKSTIAKLISELTYRKHIDCDNEFQHEYGISSGDYIIRFGEQDFRKKESEILKRVCSLSNSVIATGGGCVTYDDNIQYIRQNSNVIWIRRDLSLLSLENRPLSSFGIEDLYRNRVIKYASVSDFQVKNKDTPYDTMLHILRRIQ